MFAAADQHSLFYERFVIMIGLREYLLTVIAAGVVCSIAKHLAGEKSTVGKITKVVSGIFLTVTVLSPIKEFQLADVEGLLDDYRIVASETAQFGADMANDAIGDIIKEKTEAYILEEAKKMDIDISVEVKLCDSDPPEPDQVIITGIVSPYKKNVMSQYISDNLGISREKQKWI